MLHPFLALELARSIQADRLAAALARSTARVELPAIRQAEVVRFESRYRRQIGDRIAA